ncbi:MAG TPA: hypothetical protein VMR37_07005 [Rhabdochlamydiaceae bacterium]|jgi:hypothetical protein|nr:hypothetical protein [Rhabdochlamydiaceae bacterium]
MDNRIMMLIMALTTFIAYPFLSGDDRKQVSPLATQVDDIEDSDEIADDEDDEPVMLEDDDESDQQVRKENENINGTASDPQIRREN